MRIALCYTAADIRMARATAGYLETNMDAPVEHALVQGDLDLLDTIETVQDFCTAVAVLSANSLPKKIPRERWDPFLNTNIAWLQTDDCSPPALLKRQPFFQMRDQPNAAVRSLRLWILGGGARQDVLAPEVAEIVDAPGTLQTRDRHAGSGISAYFHQTIRIDARSRSAAGIATELSSQLSLLSSGDLAQLLGSVREALANRRVLIEFLGRPEHWTDFSSRASILVVEPAPPVPIPDEAKLIAELKAYNLGRGPEPSRAELDRALNHAAASEALVRAALGFFMTEYRLAEAWQLTDRPGDFEEERAWIQDRWSASPTVEAEQLSFAW